MVFDFYFDGVTVKTGNSKTGPNLNAIYSAHVFGRIPGIQQDYWGFLTEYMKLV